MDAPARTPESPAGPTRTVEPTPAPEDGGTPWTRGQRRTLAGLVAAMLASMFLTVHPWYDQANDAALYILTARSIAAGEGYSYLGVPFIIRPPGFSLLLAPFAAYPTNFLLLNTLVSLTGVLCVALMFAFFRPRLGTLVTAGLCAFVWLNPIFQDLCTQEMSDVPGSAFVFAALLVDRAARRRPSTARHVYLGLIIAAGLYVRSVCTLLIPAILLSRAWQALHGKRSDRARLALRTSWPVLLIPLLAWIPWGVRNARVDVPVPPEQVFLHSYSTAMWHEDAGDPDSPRVPAAEILARVPERLGEMLPLLGNGYREGTQLPVGLSVAIAALMTLCATAILIRRREPAEFLYGGVLMVLAIYFAFKPRLALTLFLLGPATMCEVALWLTSRWPRQRLVAASLALALAVPALLAFHPRARFGAIEGAASERARLTRYLDRRFPPDAPIAMPTAWHVGVETARPVYGMKVTVKRQTSQDVLDMIEEHGIVAIATSNRLESGLEYARVLVEIFPNPHIIGSWSVFFPDR